MEDRILSFVFGADRWRCGGLFVLSETPEDPYVVTVTTTVRWVSGCLRGDRTWFQLHEESTYESSCRGDYLYSTHAVEGEE